MNNNFRFYLLLVLIISCAGCSLTKHGVPEASDEYFMATSSGIDNFKVEDDYPIPAEQGMVFAPMAKEREGLLLPPRV